MKRVLRFTWITSPTTTAGHIATSLIPTNDYTRKFVEKVISPMAGCMGLTPVILAKRKELRTNQSQLDKEN
jgi:hypothetical protein